MPLGTTYAQTFIWCTYGTRMLLSKPILPRFNPYGIKLLLAGYSSSTKKSIFGIISKSSREQIMEQLTLTTPALLFSAISLIMLAYTNRFLAYAAVIRNLHDKYLDNMDDKLIEQINNLKSRLNLTRYMQIFGITSLLLCVLTMFLIYIEYHNLAVWIFGLALLLLILSLALLIREIQISIRALSLHLSDIEEHLKKGGR